MTDRFYLGVDVGTGSARAGIFDARGSACGVGTESIKIWRPAEDFVEQSSDDIWRACGVAVRRRSLEAGPSRRSPSRASASTRPAPRRPRRQGPPRHRQPVGRARKQNVVVWMDHRATEQAERINADGARRPALRRRRDLAGDADTEAALAEGKSARRPGSARHAFSICPISWSTARPARTSARSARPCASGPTSATKAGFQADYFRPIGLGDLADEEFRRIGQRRATHGRARRRLRRARRRGARPRSRHPGRRLDHRCARGRTRACSARPSTERPPMPRASNGALH